MTEKRDEARLPSPLVVMFWLNEQNQMRPIACATEDKREDSVKRAAQCYNYSTHDYVPFSALESVTRERDAAVRRVGELESMLVPHDGETWDSDKPPIRDRVFDLFDALSGLVTQEETEPVRGTLRTLLCNRETLARRVAELEKAARAYREQANALERNVYNEYHANESLSVHEVGQLCLRCSQTGAILEALITTDPAKDPTQ